MDIRASFTDAQGRVARATLTVAVETQPRDPYAVTDFRASDWLVGKVKFSGTQPAPGRWWIYKVGQSAPVTTTPTLPYTTDVPAGTSADYYAVWGDTAGHSSRSNTDHGASLSSPPPVPPPAVMNPTPVAPPASIPSDGSVEVTAALTAWIRSVPDLTTIDMRGRTYWCDRPVKVEQRKLAFLGSTLIRKGHGGIVYPEANPHWWFVDCDTIILGTPAAGIRVLGANTGPGQRPGYAPYLRDYEFEAAVRADGCVNFTSHCDLIDGIWGDGYQLQPTERDCANFRITGVLDRTGRQTITPLGVGGYVSAEGRHPARSFIDLEPALATWACRDILIEKCKAAPIGNPIAALGSGPVSDITIQDCEWHGDSVPTIHVNASDGSRRRGWKYLRNTSDGLGSPQAAVRFVNCDDVTVEGCRLPVGTTQGRRSADFDRCGGQLVVRNNDFGEGGTYLYNTNAVAGQVLTATGNTPTQEIRTV